MFIFLHFSLGLGWDFQAIRFHRNVLYGVSAFRHFLKIPTDFYFRQLRIISHGGSLVLSPVNLL